MLFTLVIGGETFTVSADLWVWLGGDQVRDTEGKTKRSPGCKFTGCQCITSSVTCVQVVVVDIDGTITKSDVRGLMATQVLIENPNNHTSPQGTNIVCIFLSKN